MHSLSQFQVQRTWLLNTNGQCFNRFITSMTRECSQATTKGQLQSETNILVSAQGILVSSRMILVIRYYQLVFQQAHGWSLIVTNQVQPNTKVQCSNMSKETNLPKRILAASYLPLLKFSVQVEPYQWASHHSILLNQGPIHEIFAKKF